MALTDCKSGTIIAVIVVLAILALSIGYFCTSKNTDNKKSNSYKMAVMAPNFSARWPAPSPMMVQTAKDSKPKTTKEQFVDSFTIDERVNPVLGVSTDYLGTIDENPWLGDRPAADFNPNSYWMGAY